jgi:hypothetical protein
MRRFAFLFVAVAAVSSIAFATPIMEVGAGDNSADLYIGWKDGFSLEFAVSFSTDTVSGLELIQIAEAGSDLDLVIQDFGWGDYVDGISYMGHSDVGFGGGEDWWHYWNKDGGEGWISPMFGASDRIVFAGSADGWVYGKSTVPEPASLLLLGLGGLMLRRKGQNRV